MIRSLRCLSKAVVAFNFQPLAKTSRTLPQLLCQPSSTRAFHSSFLLLQYDSEASDDVPTVSVTGQNAVKGGRPYSCVYWNENDPANVLQENISPGATLFHATIESFILALEQAVHENKLQKVIILSDSAYLADVINKYLKVWRTNGYTKKDGTPVKHKEKIQKMDELLSMIDAKVVLTPAAEKTAFVEKLQSQFHEEFESVSNSGVKKYDPNEAASNVIFVCAQMVGESTSRKIGYGFHVKGSNEHDVKSRFTMYPTTLVRAKMHGILEALKFAKRNNLQNVHIVSDDPIFLALYYRQWKKAGGVLAANGVFYNQIKALADELNASFRSIDEKADDSGYKAAATLAFEGIEMPLPDAPPKSRSVKRFNSVID